MDHHRRSFRMSKLRETKWTKKNSISDMCWKLVDLRTAAGYWLFIDVDESRLCDHEELTIFISRLLLHFHVH